MLRVKLLAPGAKLPTVAHPGEDLGFDVYALVDTLLVPGVVKPVQTGIAAQFRISQEINWSDLFSPKPVRTFGLLVKDRSSMAAKGVRTSAGVIDAGYTDELKIMMTATREAYAIKAGDKIAQLVPTEVFTAGTIVEVEDLGQTARGAGGFGSTGA